MASSSLQLFRDLFPEFSAVADATITAWLGVAASRLSSRAFGQLYQQAAVFMAAHFVELAQRRLAASAGGGTGGGIGLSGPITSIKTDRLSMSAQGIQNRRNMTDEFFSRTDYGLDFLSLRDSIPTSPLVMNGRYGAQIFSNTDIPEDLL